MLGGFLIAFEISVPYFLHFVKDPQTNYPLTYIILMIGYGSLSIGFLSPIGKIVGENVRKILPEPNWKTEDLYIPGLVLLLIGVFTTAFAYVVGVLGYQVAQEINSYDGLIFLFTLFSVEASFFLWLLLFRRGKIDAFAVCFSLIIFTVSFAKSLYAGNRGSLFSMVIMIIFAYLLAGGKLKFKQGVIFSLVLFFALIVGMLYGTTFRNVKQSQGTVAIDEYTGLIFETFDTIGGKNNESMFELVFNSLAERITETGSGLAVVVANYEELKPYEESYGLNDNIWNDTITTFIPRILWEDKPVASDPRKYSELYFDFGLSSFTITPMGDLLRNFGMIGVPLGMLLLGFVLRFIYASLVENQNFSAWRATLFYMLLTTVSYESFYGTILPFLVKFGAFSVLGLLLIHFLAKKKNTTTLTTQFG